jgi:hypothetical protein
VTNAGYAFSDSDAAAIFNNGNAGGSAPAGGATKIDLDLGSGTAAGPDVDRKGNSFTLSGSAYVVDSQPPANVG